MNSKIIFLLGTTISLLLISCEKEPIPYQEIWDCHHEQNWNTSNTFEALLGEWEWEYVSCAWTPDEANNDDFKGLTIAFHADSTLTVSENGEISQTASWEVVGVDGDLLGVRATPMIEQLYGRLLICQEEERIQFNDSYRDGCDNYFKARN